MIQILLSWCLLLSAASVSLVASAAWGSRGFLLAAFRAWLLAGPVALLPAESRGLPVWVRVRVPRWGRLGRVLAWLLV